MAKKVTELDMETGKSRSGKVARAKRADFDIAIVDTRAKRVIRNLIH